MATREHEPTDLRDARVSGIYEALTPRMESAKRSYVRRRVAWLFALPLIVGAGAALAMSSTPPPTTVAGTPELGEPPEDAPFVDESEPAGETPVDEELLATAGDTPPEPEWTRVELGFFGSFEVRHDEKEKLEIGTTDLPDGWKVEVVETTSESAKLTIVDGDTTLFVEIFVGPDGYEAEIVEVLTPTPKPTPTPTPKPESEPTEKPTEKQVETRKEISVYEAGKVVVERDGDKLWLGVKWTAEGFEATVLVEHGTKVKAEFVSDRYRKYVKAWIDGPYIKHQVWYEEVAPEFQTRKEISVYDKGTVLVERIGDSEALHLSVLWSHDWWEPAVVTAEGTLVHAYFTNDGIKKHVKAWTDGPLIKHETWVEEPPAAPYSGEVVCEFGTMWVLVEEGIAHVTSVDAAEGVTATVITEVGEVVKVQYDTGSEIWLVKAWGNGSEVVYEAIQTG